MQDLDQQIELFKKKYDFSPRVVFKEDIERLFETYSTLFNIDTFTVYTDLKRYFSSGFSSKTDERAFLEKATPFYEKLLPDDELNYFYCADASLEKNSEYSFFYEKFNYKSVLFIQIKTFFEYDFKKKGHAKIRKDIIVNFNCHQANAFTPTQIQTLSFIADLFHSSKLMTVTLMFYGNYLHSMLEDLPVGLLLIRDAINLSILNKAASNILGIPQRQQLQMTDINNPAIKTDDLHCVMNIFPNAKKTGLLKAIVKLRNKKSQRETLQFLYEHPNSTKRFIEAQIVSFDLFEEEFKKYNKANANSTHNIMMIIQDITERVERYNLQKELEIARNVQKTFLPKHNFANDVVETYGLNYTAKEVGGDYYDFIPNDDNELVVAIADVSGKGISAAMLMSSLQTSLRMLLDLNYQLNCFDCIAPYLNEIIYKNSPPEMFITMFYGRFNFETSEFLYCNCGHNYPILIKADHEIQFLSDGGLILGILPNSQYQVGGVKLESGDMLLCYTDGITEAVNSKNEEFGEDRLLEIIKERNHQSPQNFVEDIIKEVINFQGGQEQYDDMTLFALKIK